MRESVMMINDDDVGRVHGFVLVFVLSVEY